MSGELKDIHLGLELRFDTEENRWFSEDILLRLLGVMSRASMRYLKQHPETPKLYDSGIRYALPDQMAECRVRKDKLRALAVFLREIGASDETIIHVLRFVQGIEMFRDVPTLLQKHLGDCDNLVVYRVAELWLAGIAASPCLSSEPNAREGITYHARVMWPDGTTEDPSLLLGMGGVHAAAAREIEQQKNLARQAVLLDAAQNLFSRGASEAMLGAVVDSYGLVPRQGWREWR